MFGQNPQNSLKIAQWQVPGHSWVPFLTMGRLLERPGGLSVGRTRWFLAIFGSPWRSKNRQKIDPWLKKRSQGSFFNAFLSRMWFYSLWGSIFHRFFMKIRCKKLCIFSRQRMIFSTWRTLKVIDRRDGLSTFYFSPNVCRSWRPQGVLTLTLELCP